MKNIKYMSLILTLVSVIMITFTSCGDDDVNTVAVPKIEIDEANIEGDELCVEADIVAEGRTAAIIIEIYDATGRTLKVTHPVTAEKYIGVLNIDDFHVHVDIAGKGVTEGDQMKLTVSDKEGQATTAAKTITQEEDEDEDHHHD